MPFIPRSECHTFIYTSYPCIYSFTFLYLATRGIFFPYIFLFSLIKKKNYSYLTPTSPASPRYPVEYTAGGCALNSSRVFCWVLGEPRRVVFVGGIGKDDSAKRLSDIVEESGVITRYVRVCVCVCV